MIHGGDLLFLFCPGQLVCIQNGHQCSCILPLLIDRNGMIICDVLLKRK